MKYTELRNIIQEEIKHSLLEENILEPDPKDSYRLEEIDTQSESKLRKMIRDEVADIFFDLFKRKAAWK